MYQPKEYSYCFREDEISYINEQKKIKIRGDGREKNGEANEQISKEHFCLLYRKVEIDFTTKETILKEYLVVYIPSNYSQDSLNFKYVPPIQLISSKIEETRLTKYIKYAKINNDPKGVKSFECKKEILEKKEVSTFKISLDLIITLSDKGKNLITIEVGYNIKFIDKYFGIYHLCFEGYKYDYYDDYTTNNTLSKCTFSFILDDNYIVCDLQKEYFTEISKYKLYSFNKENVKFTLRNKKVKINIENELDKNLLSVFSADEIEQINISLNKIEYCYGCTTLAYQKVTHNIKDNIDYIKIYNIVVFPHDGPVYHYSYWITKPQPIIIKQFKINNVEVTKKEQKLGESEKKELVQNEIYEGYYISDDRNIGFYYGFKGMFGLFEFDCESNEDFDYFKLNLNSFGIDILSPDTTNDGSYYKYEIFLNGNSIKFSHYGYSYSIKNDKIIFDGYFKGNKDNISKEYYNLLADRFGREEEMDFQRVNEEEKLRNWKKLRLLECIPETMKLVEN